MTKAAALQAFFSLFTLTAYPENVVPDNAVFPRLTYTPVFGAWGDIANITVNLWYEDENETAINAKVQEISAYIGLGGKQITCDGGAIWIQRGSPFAQGIGDPTNPKIKRRYINLTAAFHTQD